MPTVTTAESHSETPADRLRTALQTAGMSQRGLARALAGSRADDRRVENERRQIARYLAGENVPTLPKSKRIAAILGGAPDEYTHSADERRQRALQLRELASLVDELRKFVEDEVDRRLAALEAKVAAERRRGEREQRGVVARLAALEAAQGLQAPAEGRQPKGSSA